MNQGEYSSQMTEYLIRIMSDTSSKKMNVLFDEMDRFRKRIVKLTINDKVVDVLSFLKAFYVNDFHCKTIWIIDDHLKAISTEGQYTNVGDIADIELTINDKILKMTFRIDSHEDIRNIYRKAMRTANYLIILKNINFEKLLKSTHPNHL